MMSAFKFGVLINILAATAALAETRGPVKMRNAPSDVGVAANSARVGQRSVRAKRKATQKLTTARLQPASKRAAKRSDEATLTTIAKLEQRLAELTADLTTHKVAGIKAQRKGQAVAHRAFFDLNGRATINLLDAEDGDIFSVDGEWHTVDYRTAKLLRKNPGQYVRNGNGSNPVFVEVLGADNAISPEGTKHLRLHHKFATHPMQKFLAEKLVGLSVAFANEDVSNTGEVRRATEQYAHPSLRVFSAETGSKQVSIKRVGKVVAERIMEESTGWAPYVLPVVKGATFKFMPLFASKTGSYDSASDLWLDISFVSNATREETKLGRMDYKSVSSLVHTASETGVYMARSNAPSVPKKTSPDAPDVSILLRVEEAYEAQTPAALKREYGEFKEVSTGLYGRGILWITSMMSSVLR
ncbi:MAG: hypothetical protein IPL79_12150 [Myxococcales bacterium]|nr:hypothetical protein [Myxococcales bacterium]